jgi:hypothetical protein
VFAASRRDAEHGARCDRDSGRGLPLLEQKSDNEYLVEQYKMSDVAAGLAGALVRMSRPLG